MQKDMYDTVSNKRIIPCVLCDSKTASVTYLGKPVCRQCLEFVKSKF